MDYLVKWQIEIDANSPREAAEEALKIHKDPESIAAVFEVIDIEDTGDSVVIDLHPETPNNKRAITE